TTLQGLPVVINAYLHNCTTITSGSTVTVYFDNGETEIQLFDDGLSGDGAANDGIYGASWTPSLIGMTTLTFTAQSGNNINTGSRTIEVVATPTISGTVTSSSGIPVEGINIMIANNFDFSVIATTDANGYYRQPVLAGSYVVTPTNNTGHSVNCGFIFVSVSTEDVIKNCSAKAIVSGTVATPSGTPVEGLQIQIVDNYNFSTILTTDANGKYSVAVDDGIYIVIAKSHTLYQTSCGYIFTSIAGLPVIKDCIATPLISGTVTTPTGEPVSGIQIKIADNYGFSVYVTTDVNGYYSQAVNNGTYIVMGQSTSEYSLTCGYAFVNINDVGLVKNCTATPL
ncbi:MAG: carboxypeptidase-like regulatory domain-containing protein, partial [Gammaproteobacteria bacterium]|nr:carboxypeptidase-like regulatory domain-containing protein [Gammaproteobacteria bacterium]